MNFFKTKPRAPPDLVRGLRDAIPRLESGASGSETRRKVGATNDSVYNELFMITQANEDVTKNLQHIKAILHGDGGTIWFMLSTRHL